MVEKRWYRRASACERRIWEKGKGYFKEMLSRSLDPLHEVLELYVFWIFFRLHGHLPFNTALIFLNSYYGLCNPYGQGLRGLPVPHASVYTKKQDEHMVTPSLKTHIRVPITVL